MSKSPVVHTINEKKIMESLKGNAEALNYIRALKEAMKGWEDLFQTAKRKIVEMSYKIQELEKK